MPQQESASRRVTDRCGQFPTGYPLPFCLFHFRLLMSLVWFRRPHWLAFACGETVWHDAYPKGNPRWPDLDARPSVKGDYTKPSDIPSQT
jgi:hypothetical protein